MLQSTPMRNKFAFLQNQDPGLLFGNGMLVPRRNAWSSSPAPARGPLDLVGGMGGLGGLGVGGLNGCGINNLGMSPYEVNGLGGLGGIGARGRLNTLFGGGGPQYWNGFQTPSRSGFSPSSLPTFLRHRNRGNNLFGNNNLPSSKSHYVYPPAEEHFTIPVFVQSSSARRSNGIFGRTYGNGNGNGNEFLLTVPSTATIQDIFVELNKGKWDYSEILVFTQNRGSYPLESLEDVLNLVDLEAECLLVIEN